MARQVSALAAGLGVVGLVYLWSAVHGANVTATARDLLAGRAPAVPDPDTGLLTVGKLVNTSGPVAGESSSELAGAAGGTGAVGNRTNGQLQAAGRGWTGTQWSALDALWTRESDWDNTATNSSSGAYGIAQFLPQTWADYGATKTSDPTVQIRAGLDYIARRYGSPAAAWAHEQRAGWY